MLLDTSGLLCLIHRAESQHAAAVAAFHSAANLVTHSYILTEFVALAQARRLPRALSLRFVSELVDDPKINVVWVDETLHRRAVSLLESRMDKTYTLTDAVSFLVMRARGLTEALTTDRHFEQEGFRRTLDTTP